MTIKIFFQVFFFLVSIDEYAESIGKTTHFNEKYESIKKILHSFDLCNTCVSNGVTFAKSFISTDSLQNAVNITSSIFITGFFL